MPPANLPGSGKPAANPSKKSESSSLDVVAFSILTCLTENDPAQRRGPKGYFVDSRKEFLEGFVPAYLACKKGNRQKFWHGLYTAWWKKYPWGLNHDQEPPTDNPEKMARLASVAPGDEVEKAAVERRLTEVWLIFRLFVGRY